MLVQMAGAVVVAMHVEDLLDHLSGSSTCKAALGSDAEIAHIFARHLDPTARAFGAVRGVNETKIKLGVARKLEVVSTVDRSASSSRVTGTGIWKYAIGRFTAAAKAFITSTIFEESTGSTKWRAPKSP